MAAKILAFSGSLRKDSLNSKLLWQAGQLAAFHGAEFRTIDLNDYELPFYNSEIQDAGFPKAADRLNAEFEQHDAILIVSPEYNHSFPAVIKNVIDWLSRYRPNPLSGKQGMLMSASPGMVGGNRGLWHLRQPLEVCGVHVHPNMFSLANAGSAFADDGTLNDEAMQRRLEETVISYIHLIDKVRR